MQVRLKVSTEKLVSNSAHLSGVTIKNTTRFLYEKCLFKANSALFLFRSKLTKSSSLWHNYNWTDDKVTPQSRLMLRLFPISLSGLLIIQERRNTDQQDNEL